MQAETKQNQENLFIDLTFNIILLVIKSKDINFVVKKLTDALFVAFIDNDYILQQLKSML